jgi:radical SAM enzyme (TIGR01210 family)
MTGISPSLYPEQQSERDRWIVAQRPARNHVDASIPYAYLLENECSSSGEIVPVATIFLTNRECPWRCAMCDLWRNTLAEAVPQGAIPGQIIHALSRLPPARHVKLYNSGSFFDPLAIPDADYGASASLLQPFERIIVECHPTLLGERTLAFRDMLAAQLEVAMGLETVNPQALAKLNKRMTTEQFRSAAGFLREHQIDLRVFVLVQPPFIAVEESAYWVNRSIDFAFACGATAVSVIPTRAGNGAMESLQAAGDFSPPTLRAVEEAFEYGLGLKQGRVFADLWDIGNFTCCPSCRSDRIARLASMNLSQANPTPPSCTICGGRA